MNDFIGKIIETLNVGLYGPKFCKKCDKVLPVQTYELVGSHFTKMDGMILTEGFTGGYVCTVCPSTVEVPTRFEPKGSK